MSEVVRTSGTREANGTSGRRDGGGRRGVAALWRGLLWRSAAVALLAGSAGAGSIFDDDWTPPGSKRPAVPAATGPSPKPLPPPGDAKPTDGPPGHLPPTVVPPTVPTPAPPTAAPPTAALPKPAAVAPVAPLVRRAVPAGAEQAKSRKLFKDVFAAELADRSPAARRALATKLLGKAGEMGDAPSDQFVLLVGAAQAGREGSDLPLSLRAADQLAARYEVDPLPFKSDVALKTPLKADAPDRTVANARACLELVAQFAAAEDYATANRLLVSARPAANTDGELAAQAQAWARHLDLLRSAADRAAPALAKLKSAPDDPAANLAVGRFLCFAKGDWGGGLPRLAKGSDPALMATAAADLAAPTDPAARADLADQWWDAAAKEPSLAVKRWERQRAALWYDRAAPGLTALRKALAEHRSAEFRKVDQPELLAAAAPLPGGGRPFVVPASPDWQAVDFPLAAGKCYRVTARGEWTDSRGTACGPTGVCPPASAGVLGPPSGLKKDQRADWYLGQHPRSALIARVGEGKDEFFVAAEATFVAPADGKLSFRINDGKDASPTRTGQLDVVVREVEPAWAAADGTTAIAARLDDSDLLHVTPEGLYWEYGGSWARVGEHDGHFPTTVNGVLWWPQWRKGGKRTDPLPVPALQPPSRVELVSVNAARGTVKLQRTSPDDCVLRFSDGGMGSSQVGCVVKVEP